MRGVAFNINTVLFLLFLNMWLQLNVCEYLLIQSVTELKMISNVSLLSMYFPVIALG